MSVRLLLLRHGPAGSRSTWTGDDDLRPLTASGTVKVEHIGAVLAAEGLAPEVIVSSPLVRCEQTATIVAAALGRSDAVVLDDALAPGFDLDDLRVVLDDHADVDVLLLVGHEPDLSDLTADLCGGRVELRKGALVELDLDRRDPTGAVLVRVEQPAHLLRGASDERPDPPASTLRGPS